MTIGKISAYQTKEKISCAYEISTSKIWKSHTKPTAEPSGLKLSTDKIKYLQKVIGSFLFYARAVDSTMLHALNTLASEQANGTETTLEVMEHFLNYCATNPEATVRFETSDMILNIESDASYLSEPQARS